MLGKLASVDSLQVLGRLTAERQVLRIGRYVRSRLLSLLRFPRLISHAVFIPAPVAEYACQADPVRVLLVDDHPIVVDALAMGLKLQGLDVAVATDLNPDRIVDQAKDHGADIVLLDLDLGGASSLRLIRPLADLGCRVVMVTGERDPADLGRCLEEGAVGVVSKHVPFERLQQAVLDAASGRNVMPEGDRLALLDAAVAARREEEARRAPFTSLTPKERQVLAHLVHGRSADEIAEAEFVSLATVRSQIQAILRKLQVNSQLAAVALAKQRQWSPED